jgi:hypothetical protein
MEDEMKNQNPNKPKRKREVAKRNADFCWVDKKGNTIDESNQHRIAPQDSCLEIIPGAASLGERIILGPSDIKELRVALDHQG